MVILETEGVQTKLPRPSLPIKEMASLIGFMGEDWRLPEVGVEGEITAREVVDSWLNFLAKAKEGEKVFGRFVLTGKVEQGFEALGAYDYARTVVGNDEEIRAETLAAARRAFRSLLRKEEMQEGDVVKARGVVEAFETYETGKNKAVETNASQT